MNITRLRPLKVAKTSSVSGSKHASEPYRIRPEAFVLLAEVLARLQGIELPIVQFVPACRTDTGAHLSRAFAAAAVARFGRTLLLDATVKAGTPERTVTGRSSNRKQQRIPGVVPDADIPGLYHRPAWDVSIGKIVTETPDTQPFRMIVIQNLLPSICPSGLDRARQCHGSILTAAAGLTTLPDLRATARQLRHAGGMLLGVILFDAPGRRPC